MNEKNKWLTGLKEGLLILALLLAYGLEKYWFGVTFPFYPKHGGPEWENHLLTILPTPLNYVFGFLLVMDGAGGSGVACIVILSCFLPLHYFGRRIVLFGAMLAIVGAVANIQARTSKPMTLILFVNNLIDPAVFTSIFLFVFALPIYLYRKSKKPAKQANPH